MERHCPERPLPSHRYLPGRTSRPESLPHPPPTLRPPEHWRENESYLYGVDCFNHGYWWEAHEAWEAIWLPLPAGDPQREFLQGLIQAAAALLKHTLGDPTTAHRLRKRVHERWAEVQAGGELPECFMGVAVEEFLTDLDRALAGEPQRDDQGNPISSCQIRLQSE